MWRHKRRRVAQAQLRFGSHSATRMTVVLYWRRGGHATTLRRRLTSHAFGSIMAGHLLRTRTATSWLWSVVVIGVTASLVCAEEDKTAIFVINVDGSRPRLLARVDGFQQHEFPRWSHDGKQVAFNAKPAGSDERRLFVVKANGLELRELGNGSMPSWSPDDKQLACYLFADNGRAELAVRTLRDDQRTLLGPGKSPCWSPNGSRMAATDGTNVSVVDLQTDEAIRLFPEPFLEVFRGFAFSPDGKRLAVTVRSAKDAKRQLLLVDAQGASHGIKTRLTSNLGGFVSFSPDGKQLIYSSDYKLYIIEVDRDLISRMVPGQRGRSHHPDWSPDGQTVVFVSDRTDL